METPKKMTHAEAGRLGALASRDFVEKQKAEAREKWLAKKSRCLNCDTLFPYEKRHRTKFCDQLCKIAFYNKSFPKRGRRENGKRIRASHNTCEKCTKPTSNPKFCSRKCVNDVRDERIYEAALNGKASSRSIKRLLYLTKGRICVICDTTTWQGQPVPLVLDHIDGDSGNTELSNFRLVCGNCDMQLPTYKGKNKGRGRASRRLRYSQGKSY